MAHKKDVCTISKKLTKHKDTLNISHKDSLEKVFTLIYVSIFTALQTEVKLNPESLDAR